MKNNKCSGHLPSQVVMGILFIGMGVLFLLDSLDVIDFRQAVRFWPAVFIVIGLAKMFDRSSNSVLVGGLFVAVGGVMVLGRLGLFYVSWHTVWPLIMIAVGALVVYQATTGKRALPAVSFPKGEAAGDDVVEATAILGGFERRITTPTFRGGDVTAIMGGCSLDMRGSSIEGEAVLNVFAVLGGITIKCPPDWTVVLHGTPILGGFEEKTATPPNSAKRLVVTGYVIMGGVEVRN
jgi:predicted membrane protein